MTIEEKQFPIMAYLSIDARVIITSNSCLEFLKKIYPFIEGKNGNKILSSVEKKECIPSLIMCCISTGRHVAKKENCGWNKRGFCVY